MRSRAQFAAWAMVVVAACTTPATGVIVTLGSDAPDDRAIAVRVFASVGPTVTATDSAFTMMRQPGMTGVTFPASFALVPGSGRPHDETVAVRFDVEVPATSNAPAIRFSRSARFAFVPGRETSLPVFLAITCGDLTDGCTHSDPCTVASLCEEQGSTCGNDGRCVALEVAPQSSAAQPLPTCAAGQTACATGCVDTRTDVQNCGACGRTCVGACNGSRCLGPDLALGEYSSCALDPGATVRCVGSYWTSVGDTRTPTSIPAVSNVMQLVANRHFTLARLGDGLILGWGEDSHGELGNGVTAATSQPPTRVGTLAGMTDVRAGGTFGCALGTDGNLQCWGANDLGQLGDGTTTSRLMPVRNVMVSHVVEFTLGYQGGCARLADGTVHGWGDLGGVLPPSGLLSSLVGEVQLCAGDSHVCARMPNGTVRCLGHGDHGQLGNGSTSISSEAVQVSGVVDAVEIACGGTHTCARRASGEVVCWGGNDDGQLGDGTTIDRALPVTVGRFAGAVAIAAGNADTCARLLDGSTRCTGYDTDGQLGDGGMSNQLTPVTTRW